MNPYLLSSTRLKAMGKAHFPIITGSVGKVSSLEPGVTVTHPDVTGLANLTATRGPIQLESPRNAEQQPGNIPAVSRQQWAILIQGYYPQIDNSMVWKDSGRIFEIISVEHDSPKSLTRLRAEEVTK
jgi:hypothetical protein